jgi:hypothetical protein
MSLPRPAGEALLARAICRTYAVLPCVITVLLGGLLSAFEAGAWMAWALSAFAAAVMAVLFPGFRNARLALNALIFAVLLSLPAAVVPYRGLPGAALGAALELAINVIVVYGLGLAPRGVQRLVQPELLPDVLTGLTLILLFGPAVVWLRRGRPEGRTPPPWDVVVLVCSYQERATIERCLQSVREAVAEVRGAAYVKSIRTVLADSASQDGTVEAAAGLVDEVFAAPPGKLSARHAATLAITADVIVAADGDRAYPRSWLTALLSHLAANERAIAVLGETANEGSGMSASALARRVLHIPMNAGNSAYFRRTYLEAPYDIAINQFRHADIWCEEEFLFSLRLARLGTIVHTTDAQSFELRPYPVLAQLSRHLFGRRLRTF